jgi:hypothetical protein
MPNQLSFFKRLIYFSQIQLWSVLGVKHKLPCALAGIEELLAVSFLSTPTAESFKSPQEFR